MLQGRSSGSSELAEDQISALETCVRWMRSLHCWVAACERWLCVDANTSIACVAFRSGQSSVPAIKRINAPRICINCSSFSLKDLKGSKFILLALLTCVVITIKTVGCSSPTTQHWDLIHYNLIHKARDHFNPEGGDITSHYARKTTFAKYHDKVLIAAPTPRRVTSDIPL